MASLNYINYINAGASLIMGLHTLNFEAGPGMEIFNFLSLRDLPRRFEQGAMTPADPFFVLFNIVALFLSMFGIIQLLPAYRASPMVQEGVKYYYAIATAAQVIALAIGNNAMEANVFQALMSTIFYSITTICTWKILNNQAHAPSDTSSEEYWMIRFPFGLQAGWSISLVIMSANVLFAMGTFMHIVIVLLSLAAYILIPVKLLLLNGENPNYIVPAILAIVTFGIGINNAVENATWETTLLLFTLCLISFASAVGTGYLVYTKEILPNKADNEQPLSENQYEGAEMTTKNEDNSAVV